MKILLSGASGMVGRNLLEHPRAEAYSWLAPSSRDLDLTDGQAVRTYLELHRPEFVIHAAGKVGGIQANIREPVDFLVRNLDMGRNVVLAAREAGVHRLLNLASSCMYPRDCEGHLSEDMVLTGALEPTNEGYALAKIAVTRLCAYIAREDPDFAYKTLVPCNLFGRWDKFDPKHSHMIPAVIRKIHEAKLKGADRVDIWGDGTARREFMYAGDLADMIFCALEGDRFMTLPSVLNVGLGHDYTINEYYQAIAGVVGYTGSFWHDTSKPVGMRRKLVSTGLLSDWGWSASTSLIDGISHAYNFFLAQEPT